MDTRAGLTLSGTPMNFSAGYGVAPGLNCTVNKCTLKLSIIAPLLLSSPANTSAPYLEYQITVAGGNPAIPLQYATISTQGYSAGFRKDITKSIRQLTTNEAADFTVFQ